MRYMQQHVHARDETPLRLDFIGDQTARLADIGNPEAAVRVVLLNVLYRGSIKSNPSTFHQSFPEYNPVALSHSDFQRPITRLCMYMVALDEGPQVPRKPADRATC